MLAGDIRKTYSGQLKEYNIQKFKLAEQKAELDEKIKKTENGAEIYADEAATLELSYNAVSSKYDEYKTYMDGFMEQWNAKVNEVCTEQSADATEDYFKDIAKIMTVARRIMHGDIVPGTDEKKLMEYDADLYQMAKNAQMMAQLREKKKYESLWEDEEKKEYEDPIDVADSQEISGPTPEVVSVEDTIAAATGSTGEEVTTGEMTAE